MGALLVAGLGAVALGGVLTAPRSDVPARARRAGGRGGCRRVAGFLVLGTGSTLGAGFTSALQPCLGVDGLSGFFLGALGLVATAALVFSRDYLEPTGAAGRSRVLTARARPRPGGRLLRPRPADVPRGWELMTLIPAAVILVARNADRVARQDRVRLPRGHAPRRAWAPGSRSCSSRARERSATRPRSAPGRGSRSRSPLAALVGMGTKAGRDAVARLATARASDRAGAGLGADERRDDQGRDLRPRPGARRLARRAAGLDRRARARGRWRSRPSAASSTRSSSTT